MTGCTDDNAQPPDDAGHQIDVGRDLDTTPTTWETGISEVLSTCTQCHGWASDYDEVVEYIDDGTFRPRIENGHQIADEDAEIVLAWIDDGYPLSPDNNGLDDMGPNDDVGVHDMALEDMITADVRVDMPSVDLGDVPTWKSDVRQILIDNECTRCHSGWATEYDSVVNRIEHGTFEFRISSGHKIEGADQQTVLDWIEAGYPEG